MGHQTKPIPDLPSLEPGVTLLETTDPGPLQTLVVDHVLLNRETAWWVDVHGHVQASAIAEIAPSRRVFERIQVARAFTAYQHYALCERLLGTHRHSPGGEPGIVVVPAVDALYRDGDLADGEGEWLFTHALAKLAAVARRFECPVLVTRTRDDELAAPIDRLAETRLECFGTENGPRFVGETFETLVYPLGDGWFQTTLAFWAHILEQRAKVYPKALGSEASIREVA